MTFNEFFLGLWTSVVSSLGFPADLPPPVLVPDAPVVVAPKPLDRPVVHVDQNVVVECDFDRKDGAIIAFASAKAPVTGSYTLDATGFGGSAKMRDAGDFRLADAGSLKLASVQLGSDAEATLTLMWGDQSTTCFIH